MEQNIKNVFDKVAMDEDKMVEIRNGLNRKRHLPMWTRAVACMAICVATLLVIPSTRTMIVNAAEKIVQIFHTADGGEVIFEEKDNELLFTISDPEYSSYVDVSGDRIYMTVDNKKIDVTEYCDKESYYRYEIVNDDGSRSVLFIGGSLEKAGFVELLFDKNGKYVFNKMQVPAFQNGTVEPWVSNAMHAEGVPCGDVELDQELED